MRAVFTKELKDFLRGRKGWCILALLLLVNGAFMTYFHFYLGYTQYEILLESMITVVAFLLPIWIVPRMSREQGRAESRFLFSLPLTQKEIFFGKLLASAVILLGMILLLGLSPLVLYFFGGADLLYSYLALAVAFLLGCAVLLALVFFSVLFRKQLFAWIASYGFLTVLVVLSKLTEVVPRIGMTVLSHLSLFDAISPLAYGLFYWEIPLWYLAVSLAFLCATFLVLAKHMDMRVTGKGILSGVAAGVLMVGCVSNAFLPTYARAWDLSADKTMSISVTTEKYLSELETDVTLYLLTDDLSEEPIKDIRFERFLERYASYSDRITLEKIPVSESGALLAEFGATPTAEFSYYVIIKSDKRAQAVHYSEMRYYQHNHPTLAQLVPTELSTQDYNAWLNMLYQYAQSDANYATFYELFWNEVKVYFKGETLLNQCMEYVSADIIPTPYVLTGHGEADMKGLWLGKFMAGYLALDLSSAQGIPADAATVLLLPPEEDYTVEEIGMLKSYLNRGGNLTVITDDKNLDMPNLMSLLSAYGLSAEKGAVRAEIEEKDKDGNEKKVITDSVPVYVNETHDALANLAAEGFAEGLIHIESGNSISFHKTENSSLITTALLTTVDTAFVSEADEKASHVLGAAAETADGAHLVWFTGAKSYLITESDMTLETDESILYPLLSPLVVSDWTNLRYTSNVPELPGVLYEGSVLQATNTNRTVFGIISILVIPALLVAAGLIRFYKRKKA